jgi:adenylate cyclase
VPVTTADELGDLSAAFNQMAKGLAERERIREAFGTYLDREVAEYILSEGFSPEGVELDVSLLFCDVRDFTRFAAEADAQEVVGRLNELFETIVPIVARHGGHVDKFVGDGLLAVFGAPERLADHANRALDAALAIDRCARETFEGDLEIAIGIDSGSVVIGNVGGGGRLDFTVIGDAVNTASRIEAATRETGDAILISDETRRRLWRAEIRLDERPPVRVKGKQQPITVYVPRLQREVAWSGPALALAGGR